MAATVLNEVLYSTACVLVPLSELVQRGWGHGCSLFPPLHNPFVVDCSYGSAEPELPLPPPSTVVIGLFQWLCKELLVFSLLCVSPYRPAIFWFNDELWLANASILPPFVY